MSSRCVNFPSHKVRPEIHELLFHRVDQATWASRDAPMGFDNPRSARMLTEKLLATYKKCNPKFDYKPRWTPPRRVLTNPSVPKHNESFDNENYDLILHVGDVLGSAVSGNQSPFCWRQSSRYTIVDMVGQGTFGQVVKCRDEEESTLVAVKVLKNKPAYFRQGLLEIGVLTAINTNWDRTGEHRTVRVLDHFLYQSHLCIVMELLSMNLFELIKQNGFRGVSVRLIRVFIRQILNALEILDEGSVVHCDLKPENILLENLRDLQVKLIDFGSACFERSTLYTYIQSRHYRSPEVILGLPYSCAIDMWSLGCIAAELFLGIPLFPGANEYNQIFKITDMLGMPPTEMIERGSRAHKFFKRTFSSTTGQTTYVLKSESEYERDNNTKIDPNKPYFMYRTLHEIVQKYPMKSGYAGTDPRADDGVLREYRKSFEHFLMGVLQIDPAKRWTPDQAIQHPFIQERPLPDNYQPPAARRRIALGSLPKPGASAGSTSNLRTAADICACYLKFNNGMRAGQVIDATNGNVLAALTDSLLPSPGVAGSRLEGDVLRRRARSELPAPQLSSSVPASSQPQQQSKERQDAPAAKSSAVPISSASQTKIVGPQLGSSLASATSTALMHRGSQPPPVSAGGAAGVSGAKSPGTGSGGIPSSGLARQSIFAAGLPASAGSESGMVVDSPGAGEPKMPRRMTDKAGATPDKAKPAKGGKDDVSMSPTNWNPFFTDGSLYESEQPSKGQTGQQAGQQRHTATAALSIPSGQPLHDDLASTSNPRTWIGRGAQQGGPEAGGQMDIAASWSQQQNMLLPRMGESTNVPGSSYGTTQFPALSTSVSTTGLPAVGSIGASQHMTVVQASTQQRMLAPPLGYTAPGLIPLGTSAPGTSFLAPQGPMAPLSLPQQQGQQPVGSFTVSSASSSNRTAPIPIGSRPEGSTN